MRKGIFGLTLILGLIAGPTPRANAEVKLHGLFTDNMVLQRDMKVPVWGSADPGEMVTVAFEGQKVSAKANDKGKWMVTLDPLKAGGPAKMTVTAGNKKIELKDILVGEVWICSGQSNMEWSLQSTRDPREVIAGSKNANIRLFDVPKTPKASPQTELGDVAEMKNPPKNRTFARWLHCDPDTVPGFSGVGYFFGRQLQKDLNVPIGLINSSWGGTAAEVWTSKQTMDNHPQLKGLNGSAMYNGMIVPLQPFAFRGVIWYQGESNAGRAKQYFHLMNAMIKNWRDDWKEGDFPFLTVQLAPWDVPKADGVWAEVREAQLFTSMKVPNTAMVVITDAGDPKDIHPKDKAVVGERLALAARALAYKEKVVYNGPLFAGVKFDGDKAVVTFKSVGGGLIAKGGALTGFTVAGKDGKFHKAEATIVENTVVARSADVPHPVTVRYGWANYPVVNLYNREGLPATPFRSDFPEELK